jgi:hypothetical protein
MFYIRRAYHTFCFHRISSVHPQIRELVNLQEVNGKAKPYQVRQFLRLVELYDLKSG